MSNLNPNQFALVPVLGQLDLHFNPEIISAMIDYSASAVTLVPGQAVTIVDSAGGVPKVIPAAASSSEVFGFVIMDRKNASFTGGDALEIAQAGTVIYLQATAAIARGAQVELVQGTVGGIRVKTGASGADIVGYALDKATAGTELIRVKLGVPSFAKA